MKHIDNFQELLPLPRDQIIELPDLSEMVRQDGKYTRPRIDTENVRAILAPGLTSSPEGYTPMSLRRLGRDDSRHAVHFGLLTLENGERKAVAVKDCKLSWGLGEVAVSDLALSNSLYAFKPLGLLVREETVHGEPLAHLITEYDDELKTLDSFNWSRIDPDEGEAIVHNVASATSNFHSHGLFHGDAKPRNIGQRTTGETGFIDLEHTVGARDILEIASTNSLGARAQLAAQEFIGRNVRIDFRDIMELFKVLPATAKLTEAQRLKHAEQAMIEPYIQELDGKQHPYGPVLVEAAKRAYTTLRDE